MTTTTTTALTGPLTANGVTPLPFTFQAISASEVGVIRNGAEVTTGFTVALNGDNTGSVTPTSTWATDTVYLFSKPSYQQPTDFSRFGAWYPDQLVTPLDRNARAIIANKAILDRAFQVAIGKTGYVLPSATVSSVLGVDASGNGTAYTIASLAGANGTNGTNGAAATVTIGSTTTLAAGSSATAVNVGTSAAAIINFGIPQGAAGSGSTVSWGGVLGTLSNQTDLQNALNLKATLAAPTFTGVPAAPTAAVDTNTTQLATTAFVIGQTYAKLAAPTFTGVPAAPTAAVNTNTTQIATTAFVLGQQNTVAGTIAMNGAQAAGASTLVAKADHVHPVDTSRAPLASPTFTGVPVAPTPAFGTATTQLATAAMVDAMRDIPLLGATAARALVLTDRMQLISNTTGGWSIPANASVAFPVGSIVFLFNDSASAQSITITTDTLRLDGTASTGTRTLAGYGMGYLYKTKTTEWVAGGKAMT